MNHTKVQEYLLSKPEAVVTYPYGEDTAVFKVKHKMFATLYVGQIADDEGNLHWWLNLKSDADEALQLRETYKAVIPGHHMNKKLWNTVILNGSIPEKEVIRMMDDSFQLVVDNMPARDQESILAKLQG